MFKFFFRFKLSALLSIPKIHKGVPLCCLLSRVSLMYTGEKLHRCFTRLRLNMRGLFTIFVFSVTDTARNEENETRQIHDGTRSVLRTE